MKSIISLIFFSIKENLRTKIYLVLLVFTVVMVFLGLLLTGLSGFEQPQRVLVNSGLAMIELFCLFVILLNSAGLLLQDIESKSVYLILSKPISRTKYVVSKYLGLLSVTVVNTIIMMTIHLIFIKLSRWYVDIGYFIAIFTIILKTGIIAGISLLLVMSMTSQTAAVITSLLLWIAGHFLKELNFIIKKIPVEWIKYILRMFYYIIPNFQYLNFKDYFDNKYFIPNFNPWASSFYWIMYVGITVALTTYVFKKKNL